MGDGEGPTSKKHDICSGVVSVNALSSQGDMCGNGWGENWDGASSGGRTSTSASVIGRTDAGQG